MSDLKFDDYYNRLSIQELLVDAGYKFNRRDGLRYPSYVRLDNDGRRIPGDKFLVTPNGKGCFKPPTMRVFNVVSFITEHPDLFQDYRPGMDPYRLVNLVCSRLLNEPVEQREQKIIEPHKEQAPFNIKDYEVQHFQKYNFDNIKKFYPYFKTRGINTSTQKAFGNHFMLAGKPSQSGKVYFNLSFPISIPGHKETVGFEERGMPRLDGSSGYKGKARGSNSSEGLWIASPNSTPLKDAKDVLWFESAFDAMAYYQIHNKGHQHLNNAVFLSTGGTPTVMQFRGVIKEAQTANHHLCFDNDLAGKQFAMNFQTELKRIRESLPKIGEDIKEYIDSLKDENNILSGNTNLLPENVYIMYNKYIDASEELSSMREVGLYSNKDIDAQEIKVSAFKEEFRQVLYEKLSIGMEEGHLKDLGTYDIPEWALCAMENGDYEGLSEEEEHELNTFMERKFPQGYVSDIDWDNPDEFNRYPAFGPRNLDALTNRGESPYLAVKTFPVHFFHPTEREAYALPNLTFNVETPKEGCKDWNEQLLKAKAEQESIDKELESEEEKISAGIDIDSDGDIELNESDERKHHHSMGR